MAAVINPAYALTLKIATLSPDGSGWMTKMRAGATEIEQKTQQRVTFKFYTGGTMGNDRAVLNKIKIMINQISTCNINLFVVKLNSSQLFYGRELILNIYTHI